MFKKNIEGFIDKKTPTSRERGQLVGSKGAALSYALPHDYRKF
jgi:hypothetical protein